MIKIDNLDLRFVTGLLYFLGFVLFVIFFGTTMPLFRDISFEKTGQMGDSLSGFTAPIIGILAVFTTFIAFIVQYIANEQHKKDLQVERFENKFYNLLQIHRNNVTEIGVGKSLYGRKTFISMFNEFKYIYLSTIDFYTSNKAQNGFPEISPDKLYNISYLIFFFGIGPNSTKVIHDLVGSTYDGFIQSLEEYLKGCQNIWRDERKKKKPIAANSDDGVFHLNITYKPCNGHMSKLSHYVRHLFQLVKFVDQGEEKIFNYDSKYNYIATVRSQLSNHEQLLLFYNAVSVLGQPWLEEPNLMKKYCLIKSTPLPLADFYKNPMDVFGVKNEHGKVMFEWIDIKERLANA